MTARRPLVRVGGRNRQLPAGDTVPASAIPEVVAGQTHGAALKSTPVDADEIPWIDSAASWVLAKLNFGVLKSAVLAWAVSQDNNWAGKNVFQQDLLIEGETGPEVDLGIRAYGRAPVLHGYLANGTKASPSATTINQLVLGVGGRSWTGTKWSEHSTAAIHFATTENHSDTAQGTNVAILATPIGLGYADRVKVAEFNGDGDIINSRGVTQRKVNSGERSRGIEIYREGNTAEFSMVSTATVPYASLFRGYSVGGSAAGGYSATVSGQGTGYALCGHDGSGFVGAKALIGLHAGANWTTTSTPTRIEFQTTVTGSTVRILRFVIDEAGNAVATTGLVGYTAGSGDVVTQATSKTTSVTINRQNGSIVMNNAALAAGAQVLFKVANSFVGVADHVLLTLTNSNGTIDTSQYQCWAVIDMTSAGFYVVLRNISGGSLSQAVRLNFVVFKGSAS
ncbi:hypothetical protein [Delftia tsuruhatensis]|uniref:hypothetical protein n=1 Tax=Delftia tsuruhatensis TaxID=180282 RepID=UPI0039BCD1A2